MQLRDYSVDELVIAGGHSEKLAEFAELLDQFANLRMYMGVGPEMDALIEQIDTSSGRLIKEMFGDGPLGEGDLAEVREVVSSSARKLALLAGRARSMADSARVEEVMFEAAAIGWPLLRTSQYNISPLGSGIQERLHDVGFKLHVLETTRLFLDGGEGVRGILETINEANIELSEIAKSIDGK